MKDIGKNSLFLKQKEEPARYATIHASNMSRTQSISPTGSGRMLPQRNSFHPNGDGIRVMEPDGRRRQAKVAESPTPSYKGVKQKIIITPLIPELGV